MSKKNEAKNKSNHQKRMAKKPMTQGEKVVDPKKLAKEKKEARKALFKKVFTIFICALLVLLFALPSLSGLISCSSTVKKDTDFSEKIDKLVTESEENPDDTSILVEIADEYLNWGKAIHDGKVKDPQSSYAQISALAVTYYEQSGMAANDSEIAFNMAVANAYAGNYDTAISALNEMVSADDSNVDAWYALGLAYSGKGDTDSAITAYQRVVDLDPNSDAGEYAAQELEYLR